MDTGPLLPSGRRGTSQIPEAVKPPTHHKSIRSEGTWTLGTRGELGLLSRNPLRLPLSRASQFTSRTRRSTRGESLGQGAKAFIEHFGDRPREGICVQIRLQEREASVGSSVFFSVPCLDGALHSNVPDKGGQSLACPRIPVCHLPAKLSWLCCAYAAATADIPPT